MVKNIKKIAAIWAGKLTIFVSKLLGKKGSSMPGQVSLKLYPSLLKDSVKYIKKDIITICGTNGKTTTNNILYNILTDKGYKVVCNNVGANMLEGVTTAFIKSYNIFGKINADYACLEIDEASSLKIFDHIKPDYLVLTNLFRDQLDRYGEIDITMNILKQALKKTPDIKLIINGDDPLCASFGYNNNTFDKNKNKFYGIDENINVNVNETKEGRFCVMCGNELDYEYYHYSQLGNYKCSCGFRRPLLDYSASNINLTKSISFNMKLKNNDKLDIYMDYKGFYNIYNIMAAVSISDFLDIDCSDINNILSKYRPQIGRMETFNLGKPVILNLSKNPAGFNQAISTVLQDKRLKDIMIVINDNAQDGKDISWIWDVDFEKLLQDTSLSFTASGIRKDDVLVRLKYAGVDLSKVSVIGNLKDAIINTTKKSGSVTYILVNYTALFKTQTILKKLEKVWKDSSDKKEIFDSDTGLNV